MITYHGHLGKKSHTLVEYFEGIDSVPRLTEGLNPATCAAPLSAPLPAPLGEMLLLTSSHSNKLI